MIKGKTKEVVMILAIVFVLVLVGSLSADELVYKFGTVLSKFIRNLESRIYSTLAKDISESLFNYSGIPTSENPIAGEISLEGNILKWINNGDTITLIIEEWFDGVLVSTTEIVIPVGSFGGCWVDCDG